MYHSSEARSSFREEDIAMQAGYTSLLNGGSGVDEVTTEVKNEVAEFGYSPTTEGTNMALREFETKELQSELPALLADPNYTDEQKAWAMEYVNDPHRPETTMVETLSKDFNEAATPKTGEQLSLQQGRAALINQYADWKQVKQAVQDGDYFSSNASAAAKGVDFLSLMVPFYEQSIVAEAVAKARGGDFSQVAEAFVFMGSAKQGLIDAFQQMSLPERAQAAHSFAEAIRDANTVAFVTNDMNGKMLLDAVLNGDYTDIERTLDNMVSLMDASIFAKPVAGAVAYGRVSSRIARAEKLANTVKPTSPIRVADDVSSEAVRDMHKIIAQDETGEAAMALAGTTKPDALADGLMPELAKADGSVRNKTLDVDRELIKTTLEDRLLADVINDTAIGALTRKEIESANAHVVTRMQEAVNLTPRKEMFTVESLEGGANIRAVYGAGESGWESAEDAFKVAEIALRDLGITRADMTLLKRDATGDFVPHVGEIDEAGEYLLGIDHKYNASFADVQVWDQFTVKRNFLDQISPLAAKSVNRNIFDPASMFDPHVTLGANAAVEKVGIVQERLLQKGSEFTQGFSRMGKEEKAAIQNYIEKANEEGLKFNPAQIKTDFGISEEGVELIRGFRDYWDDVWAIRNELETRAMRNKGYQVLEDATNDTRLFGVPQTKGMVDLRKPVYDADTGNMRKLNSEELEKLYETGGGAIKMRRPMTLGDDATDIVIHSRDKLPRGLRDGDKVMPYRDGYYQRGYEAPHFIVEKITLKDGSTYTKARATAQTTEDATVYRDRLAKMDTSKTYEIMHDVKDRDALAGFEMDVYETFGRSMQRTRGKQLEDATAILKGSPSNHLTDPIDAIQKAAVSLANRASMTDYMDAAKKRFFDQYKDLFPLENGQPKFPENMGDIGSRRSADSKRVADARSTFEYIAYLENGYTNMLDDFSKGAMRGLADFFGKHGLGSLEKVFRSLGKAEPVQKMKATAFHLYLGLNPLRSFMLNAHQSSLLLANFPKYTATRMPVDATAMTFALVNKGAVPDAIVKMTGRSQAEWKIMYEEYLKSGLPSSVTANNLARAATKNMVDAQQGNAIKSIGGAVDKGLNFTRKIGFDAGEHISLMTAWLAHYDKVKSGKAALNKTDFHQIGAQARSYTFNMNRAGDMAYNQNSLSAFFQFFQVPHKAMLNSLFNRTLTRAERRNLLAYNAVAFTLPPKAMYQLFGDSLPDENENPELHAMVVQGLQFYMFNKGISLIAGEDAGIDFSSAAPSDMFALYEFMSDMATTEVGSALSNTPAGQLVFGNNPRITNLFKTMGRYFNVAEDFDNNPTELSDVMREFAELSSGMGNFFRAKMALETERLMSRSGVVLDETVVKPEAIALLFGFRTLDEARTRLGEETMFKQKDKLRKEVEKFYRDYTAQLSRDGMTNEEADRVIKVMSQGMRVFKDYPAAMETLQFLMERDARKGMGVFHRRALEMSGVMTPEEFKSFLTTIPEDDKGTRGKLQQIAEDIDKIRGVN